MPTSNPILDAALAYAARGWEVLPLHGIRGGACTCRKASCKRPGKHPLSLRGLKDASTNPAQIHAWFARRAWCNLAIAAGASGLAVLDVDERKGGLASLRRLGTDTRRAGKVRSGNGWHLYFLGRVATSVGKLGSGLDVRSVGGYAVAPPSRHASGAVYAWVREVRELPPWPFADPEIPALPPASLAIPEGQRNDRLFRLAGSLHLHAVPSVLLLEILLLVNERVCQPPLAAEEVREIARKILRRPRAGASLRKRSLGRAGNAGEPAAASGGSG